MSDQQMDQEKSYVADNEIVYRMISSPLGYNEVTGVSPDCFKLFRKNESYISVERAKYSSLDEALSNGEKIKMWFADGETFWGLASLKVSKIRKHELLEVISKYTDKHPGHAGIQMMLSEDNQVYKNKDGEPTPINKNLQVYRELFQNPPFPAWRSASRMGDACSEGLKKEGLNEVWN